METTKNNDEIEIDLREILDVLLAKLAVILLVAVLGAIVAFTYTKFMIAPTYSSKTQIYVQNTQSTPNATTQVSVGELQSSTYLTKDYLILCKSNPVLKKVIEELKLNMTEDALAAKISVSTPTDTRIITISVTDTDPYTAKNIADAVREAAKVQIVDVTGVEAVNDVEEAKLPDAPIGPNMKLNIIIGFLLGFVLAAGIVVVRFMLDDSIKSQDDVEKYLGLSVLGLIPLTEGTDAKKKKKKK